MINKITTETRVEKITIPISIYAPADWEDKKNRQMTLLIYGGTKEFKHSAFNPLKNELANNGFAAASFDFRGNIAGGPYFEETSLISRLQDCLKVLERLKNKYPSTQFTLLGVSMGGYISVLTANNFSRARNLVLVAPAAYHPDAKYYKFGDPTFTKILRKNKNWAVSDGFQEIQKYQGSLLVIKYEKDEVIPAEIPHLYFQKAINANRTFIEMKDYYHRGYTFQSPYQEEIANLIIQWLKKRS